jgi:ABC-type transporter Mla subunit MlaD
VVGNLAKVANVIANNSNRISNINDNLLESTATITHEKYN